MSTKTSDYIGLARISQRRVTGAAVIFGHRTSAGSYTPFEYCDALARGLKSAQMQDRTETLQRGSRAPDFSLHAANREGEFSLRSLLQDGNLILEFLRGTW
ncbi:MAG TPA: hypothetical protein VMT53_12605 [Terriglobales bacterium]|nr:hypothetical protein [Terriglobales bacterium]